MAGEDEDEPFIRAWEEREEREFVNRDLGPIFREHGIGRVDRTYQRAEQQRVATILLRDRAYQASEQYREEAMLEVAAGKTVRMRDAADAPTTEQIERAKHDGAGYARYTPRLENGTSATVKGYRRRDLPQVQRMVLAGVIDGQGLRDCIWYRNLVESAGLTGNIGSVDYGREVFMAPHSRSAFTDRQVEQQDTLRAVRTLVGPMHLALLNLVVIDDVPIWRAVRSLRAGIRLAKRTFARAVEQLHDARTAVES